MAINLLRLVDAAQKSKFWIIPNIFPFQILQVLPIFTQCFVEGDNDVDVGDVNDDEDVGDVGGNNDDDEKLLSVNRELYGY